MFVSVCDIVQMNSVMRVFNSKIVIVVVDFFFYVAHFSVAFLSHTKKTFTKKKRGMKQKIIKTRIEWNK